MSGPVAYKRVKPEKLAKELNEILESYANDVCAGTVQSVKTISKAAAKDLKATSPVHHGAYTDRRRRERRPGSYAKGWTSTNVLEMQHKIKIIVHNKDEYRLAHLLEKGHVSNKGGHVPAHVHIKPIEDHYTKELEKQIEILVRK